MLSCICTKYCILCEENIFNPCYIKDAEETSMLAAVPWEEFSQRPIRENWMADFCHVILHHVKEQQHFLFFFFNHFLWSRLSQQLHYRIKTCGPGEWTHQGFRYFALYTSPSPFCNVKGILPCRKWPLSIDSCTTKCTSLLQQPSSSSYARLEYLRSLMCTSRKCNWVHMDMLFFILFLLYFSINFYTWRFMWHLGK